MSLEDSSLETFLLRLAFSYVIIPITLTSAIPVRWWILNLFLDLRFSSELQTHIFIFISNSISPKWIHHLPQKMCLNYHFPIIFPSTSILKSPNPETKLSLILNSSLPVIHPSSCTILVSSVSKPVFQIFPPLKFTFLYTTILTPLT